MRQHVLNQKTVIFYNQFSKQLELVKVGYLLDLDYTRRKQIL